MDAIGSSNLQGTLNQLRMRFTDPGGERALSTIVMREVMRMMYRDLGKDTLHALFDFTLSKALQLMFANISLCEHVMYEESVSMGQFEEPLKKMLMFMHQHFMMIDMIQVIFMENSGVLLDMIVDVKYGFSVEDVIQFKKKLYLMKSFDDKFELYGDYDGSSVSSVEEGSSEAERRKKKNQKKKQRAKAKRQQKQRETAGLDGSVAMAQVAVSPVASRQRSEEKEARDATRDIVQDKPGSTANNCLGCTGSVESPAMAHKMEPAFAAPRMEPAFAAHKMEPAFAAHKMDPAQPRPALLHSSPTKQKTGFGILEDHADEASTASASQRGTLEFVCRVVFQDDKQVIKPIEFSWQCCAKEDATVYDVSIMATQHFASQVSFLVVGSVLAMDSACAILSLADRVCEKSPAIIICTGMFLATQAENKKVAFEAVRARHIFNELLTERLVTSEAHSFMIEADSQRSVKNLMIDDLVDFDLDFSHPDNIQRLVGHYRDVESFVMQAFKLSLVPLHVLSIVLQAIKYGRDSESTESDFFVNRYSLDPQAIIAKNLDILGVKQFFGNHQPQETQFVVRGGEKIAQLLLKLNNQRNNWFHFAHLQWTEQQLQNEAFQVVDLSIFLATYCISQDTVDERKECVKRAMRRLGALRSKLLEREALMKRSVGFMSLSQEQRQGKAAKCLEYLAAMLSEEDEDERERAEQFVLTRVAPYLDIKCRGAEEAFRSIGSMSYAARELALDTDPFGEEITTPSRVSLEKGSFETLDVVFLIDLDHDRDTIVFWQSGRLVRAVLSEMDPNRVMRQWKSDLTWSMLALNLIKIKASGCVIIKSCFSHSRHPWRLVDGVFVWRNSLSDSVAVYRLEYSDDEIAYEEYRLSYDWVSSRANAYLESEHSFAYQNLYARLLFHEESNLVYLLGVPFFQGKVTWNEEKMHSRVEPITSRGDFFIARGLRPQAFNLPNMDFLPDSTIKFQYYLDVERGKWCPAYKSCRLLK